MIERNNLLHQLSSLLKWKESKKFYAEKLGITVGEVNELLAEIRSTDRPSECTKPECGMQSTLTQKGLGSEYFVAGGWVRDSDMSLRFSKKEDKHEQKTSFVEFLKTFKPKDSFIVKEDHIVEANSCLVLNIQDAHFNKYDINGNNDIHARFKKVKDKIEGVLKEVSVTSNLDKVVYVLGSDIFNSEWTDMTTKGTPQTNILSYQEGFKAICQHEVDVLEMLVTYADNVEVMYCPGNHDEFVGWHMMSWLQTYFKRQSNMSFDISPKYTKYIKFGNTAMCFNHGDGAKPEVIAKNFPFEFKEGWATCEHFLIFGGDKHTELSKDLGGIKFYRIPALSTSQSKWDSKNGYRAQAELTGFLIYEDGAMDIKKRPI